MTHCNLPALNKSGKKIILHIFSTFNVGGTEVRTCELITNLISYHHIIRILKDGTAAQSLLNNLNNFSIIQTDFPSQTLNAVLTAKKEIDTLNPDLIITYSWGAIEWLIANTLFNHKPLIHTEDGFTDELPHKQKTSRIITRILFFKHASKLVVPAVVLKQVAVKKWLLPSGKIEYIPNGVNVKKFTPLINRRKNDPIILGIIGTIYPVKNHIRLLNIISKIPPEVKMQLWIIGNGPELEKVKIYGETHAISDRLKFWGLRKDTCELLQQMDIFCLSSDHEQMPITILEAMSTGLPIMSTDVGDIKEMVAEPNQQFIIFKDNEDLYLEKLQLLIQNEKLRQDIGKANRKKCCSDFSNELMYKKYSALVYSLIK